MTRPLRVLHVDDDADIREIALLSLETVGGLDVLQCASGREALDGIDAFQPDVLLLDVMMPEMSGQQLLTEIRKLPGMSGVPAIFMTARVQPAEIAAFRELGAADVSQKPFDPMALSSQLIETVERCRVAAG